MVTARDEILTVGVAVVAEPAQPPADRGIGSTDVHLFAVLEACTFVSGFIKVVVLLERAVFFDLLGDRGGILAQLGSNGAEGEPLL